MRDSEALLLAYVRFLRKGVYIEDLLFAKALKADTKGLSIFNVVEDFFTNKKNPLANVISCATDGAPAMVGRHRGFIAHLKKSSPGVFTIHCIVHR